MEPIQQLFPHGSWAMKRDRILWVGDHCTTHGPWVVQQYIYSMDHGLHNRIPTPWFMGCATGYQPHGSWVAQQGIHPMVHGLCDSISTPCIMGCATGYLPHASWVAQQGICPMHHALCNSISTPWSMGCTRVYLPTKPAYYWTVTCY